MTNKQTEQVFQPGDGATECLWSDRHAGTILSVSANGKKIEWQSDKATRTDNFGMSDDQSYSYAPNPNGRIRTYTLRKNGRYVQEGDEMKTGTSLVRGRHEFHDFSF